MITHREQTQQQQDAGRLDGESVAAIVKERLELMADHEEDRLKVRESLEIYRRTLKATQNSREFRELQADFDVLKDRVDEKKSMLARLEALANNLHARATYAAEILFLHHQALQGPEADLYNAVSDVTTQIRRTRAEWRLLNEKLLIKRQHQGQRKKVARDAKLREFARAKQTSSSTST